MYTHIQLLKQDQLHLQY